MRSRLHLSTAVTRGAVCALVSLALAASLPGAAAGAAAPDPGSGGRTAPAAREAERIPFAARWSALQHGGLVRAANTAVTCRAPAVPKAPACPKPAEDAGKAGEGAARSRTAPRPVSNGDYSLFYTDVDKDPNTYNSTRARLRVPQGARISYARLYWGGNLRVGEQKPPKDSDHVLLSEPGGDYRKLSADTVTGHRVGGGAEAFQSSADVTGLVRASGPGLYTVAQINVAMGNSPTGGWGGWTLVVAYEKKSEPLRHLALWDGFETLHADEHDRRALGLELPGVQVAPGAAGRVGVLAYDGDRGIDGDSLVAGVGRAESVPLGDAANPSNDVFNSTVGEAGRERAGDRVPAYANTFGYDSDVFTLDRALRPGGRGLRLEFAAHRDSVWLGALFVQADAPKGRQEPGGPTA